MPKSGVIPVQLTILRLTQFHPATTAQLRVSLNRLGFRKEYDGHPYYLTNYDTDIYLYPLRKKDLICWDSYPGRRRNIRPTARGRKILQDAQIKDIVFACI
jgi:hypothetical protein